MSFSSFIRPYKSTIIILIALLCLFAAIELAVGKDVLSLIDSVFPGLGEFLLSLGLLVGLTFFIVDVTKLILRKIRKGGDKEGS